MMGYTVSAVQISANRRTAFLLAQALNANFRELRNGEGRRNSLPRTPVNSPKPTPQGVEMSALGCSHKVCFLVSLTWGAAGPYTLRAAREPRILAVRIFGEARGGTGRNYLQGNVPYCLYRLRQRLRWRHIYRGSQSFFDTSCGGT